MRRALVLLAIAPLLLAQAEPKLVPDISARSIEIRYSFSGAQLLIEDSANPADRLFVARSETSFLSSLSQVAIEFVKNSQGDITHFVRSIGGREEKAVKK